MMVIRRTAKPESGGNNLRDGFVGDPLLAVSDVIVPFPVPAGLCGR
jgi:hypothetical protein